MSSAGDFWFKMPSASEKKLKTFAKLTYFARKSKILRKKVSWFPVLLQMERRNQLSDFCKRFGDNDLVLGLDSWHE